MTHAMLPAPEIAPGISDYWAAVTDVACPRCDGGTVRWDEAGHVPGYRTCDGCGRSFFARGTAAVPLLVEDDDAE